MMNIEDIREFCLSLPMVTEDMAFGEDHLLFRVCDKIFACMSLDSDGKCLALKCDPEYALELRARYADITGAFHWNKKYWNQLRLDGDVPPETIVGLIRHSYSEVVRKIPKKTRERYPEISGIHQ